MTCYGCNQVTHNVAVPPGFACALCGHTHNVVIYSKFHQNPLRGFGATWGQNLPFPITLTIGFYNSLYKP